jgi:hypothetical protein
MCKGIGDFRIASPVPLVSTHIVEVAFFLVLFVLGTDSLVSLVAPTSLPVVFSKPSRLRDIDLILGLVADVTAFFFEER